MKLIKNIALFILTTIVVYLGVVWFMLRVDYQDKAMLYPATGHIQPPGGQAWYMLHGFGQADKYNLIIVGSSHAYRGYDPRIFDKAGYKTYNLGSSNQSMVNTYILIKHLIPAEWKGTLVLDIYEETLENESIESTANLIANLPDASIAREIAFTGYDIRNMNMLTARMLAGGEPNYEDGTYVTKGYCSRADKRPPDFKEPEQPVFKVNEKALEYFNKLLSLLKERNIEYVVINAPAPSWEYEPRHDDFLEVVQPVINAYNATFFDLAYGHDLSAGVYFYDETHLNQAGVDIFNAEVINRLKSR